MKCFFCWYIYVRSRPTRNSDESRSKFKFISNDICMKIERVAQEWRKNAPTIDPATRQTDQAKWVEHLNNLIEYDFCAFAPANPIHSINFDQISDFDAHVLDCKWEKINGTIKKLKWSSIHIFFFCIESTIKVMTPFVPIFYSKTWKLIEKKNIQDVKKSVIGRLLERMHSILERCCPHPKS